MKNLKQGDILLKDETRMDVISIELNKLNKNGDFVYYRHEGGSSVYCRTKQDLIDKGFKVKGRGFPQHDDEYYVPSLLDKEYYIKHDWVDDPVDKRYKERDLCYRTKEEAIERAKQILKS